MACIWSGIFLAQALMYWGTLFSISWRPGVIFSLGVLLMIAGVGFRWYAIQVLGGYFTFPIATHHEQIVVQKSPYRFIPHPSYTGTLITMFCLCLAYTNLLSLV